MITVFKTWGIPKWIKVDNGRPFGDPQLELIPPLSLWLIGLGIKVIWNKPRSPKQNAKVERSQRTMANWTEFHKCKNSFDLQLCLWEKADFYNFHFPMKRFNNKKLVEKFPELVFTGQKWNPANFKIERALEFLSKGNWKRTVSKVGQIPMYNSRFSVGAKYKHQRVSIKLCPDDNTWQVFDYLGSLIKSLPTNFDSKSVWHLDFS